MIRAFDAQIPFLFHYQRFNEGHLEDLLKNRRVYCSEPGNLNDPWDCRPFFDVQSVNDPDTRQQMIEYFRRLTPSTNFTPQKEALMDYMMANSEFTQRNLIMNCTRSLLQIIEEKWRVYCLIPDVTSTLMWSHYGENHKGICLEFNVKANTIFGQAMQVEYSLTYPQWKIHEIDENRTIEILLTKADCWKYEQEYRIVGRVLTTSESKSYIRLPIVENNFLLLPDGSLNAIILGCEMPKIVQRKACNLVKTLMPEVAVKIMRRQRNDYKLEVANYVCA